jgi:serine O-acetyltransferase
MSIRVLEDLPPPEPIELPLAVNVSDSLIIRRSWWNYYRADIRRYKKLRPGAPLIKSLLLEQGLWALLQYRVASAIYRSKLSLAVKQPLLLLMVGWQKVIEILTGIHIPYSAQIGAGFYIGHFGNIILHGDAIIGEECNISQGVTIGISGRGDKKGVPMIGNRVYIAANAVVTGKITIGDNVVIGACSLVNRDIPPNTTVLGVPAQVVTFRGSEDYIV